MWLVTPALSLVTKVTNGDTAAFNHAKRDPTPRIQEFMIAMSCGAAVITDQMIAISVIARHTTAIAR